MSLNPWSSKITPLYRGRRGGTPWNRLLEEKSMMKPGERLKALLILLVSES
jgi:hypothetical protein